MLEAHLGWKGGCGGDLSLNLPYLEVFPNPHTHVKTTLPGGLSRGSQPSIA